MDAGVIDASTLVPKLAYFVLEVTRFSFAIISSGALCIVLPCHVVNSIPQRPIIDPWLGFSHKVIDQYLLMLTVFIVRRIHSSILHTVQQSFAHASCKLTVGASMAHIRPDATGSLGFVYSAR